MRITSAAGRRDTAQPWSLVQQPDQDLLDAAMANASNQCSRSNLGNSYPSCTRQLLHRSNDPHDQPLVLRSSASRLTPVQGQPLSDVLHASLPLGLINVVLMQYIVHTTHRRPVALLAHRSRECCLVP